MSDRMHLLNKFATPQFLFSRNHDRHLLNGLPCTNFPVDRRRCKRDNSTTLCPENKQTETAVQHRFLTSSQHETSSRKERYAHISYLFADTTCSWLALIARKAHNNFDVALPHATRVRWQRCTNAGAQYCSNL